MFFMMKVILVVALVRLLIHTNKPAVCAGLYITLICILGLMLGWPFKFFILRVGISFGLAFLYFWLLDKFEESALFWLILLLGLPFVLL